MAVNAHDLSALMSLLKESSDLAVGADGAVSTSSGPVQPQPKAQTASVVRFGGVGAPAGASAGFDAKSIWSPEEVLSVHEVLAAASASDARRRPEFDFAFKQRVGSEDVFLGLAGTTESSTHCDTMVMRILLPGERLCDIDLDCTEERIVVSAAQQCVRARARGRCVQQPAACALARPSPSSHHPPCRNTHHLSSLQQALHLSPQQGVLSARRGQVGRSKVRPAHFLPLGQV